MSKFTNYDEYVQSVSSEKVVVAHMEAVRRLFNFQLDVDLGIYKKQTTNFVVAVEDGTTELALLSVASPELVTDATKYHYDLNSSTLYLFSYSQQESEVIVTYRYFFSNAPINLPWDLTDDGAEVYYEPRISTYPNFVSQYAQGKKAISLTGSGTIKIENTDGALNTGFDTLIWENRPARIYSVHRDLLPSQAKLIFRGIVDGKAFSTNYVSFTMKDEIFALKERIPLSEYASEVRDEDKENCKRWIYGKANNVRMQSITQVGSGFPLTPPPVAMSDVQGSIYGVRNDVGVTGVNTKFLSYLTSGDTIILDGQEIRVDQVVSDLYFTCDELPFTFNLKTDATVLPEKGYYANNRTFQLSGHALKQVATSVVEGFSPNRFTVASVQDLYANDFIEVNGEERQIRRITAGNLIVLKTNLSFVPTIDQFVAKEPLRNFRYLIDDTEHTLLPEYVSYTNDSTGVRVTITRDAEKLSTPNKTMKEMATFINGRRTIWLGAPTLIDLQCIGATWNGSTSTLWGKYFLMYDDLGRKLGFWFGDNYEIATVLQPPAMTVIEAENGARVTKIEIPPNTLTPAEVAAFVSKAISDASSIFDIENSSTAGLLLLASKKDTAIANGSALTSGFTFVLQSTGIQYNNQNNFTELVKPRDWVRDFKNPYGDPALIEVLDVAEKRITLRTPWTGTNKVDYIEYRDVDYIQDDTQVYVDVLNGKTEDGTINGPLIDSHPKIVRDLVKAVGLGDYLDEPTFTSAHDRSPYMPSLLLPIDFTGGAPETKTIIDICNKSTLGSLHLTDALTLGYDIFDGYINNYISIKEDDVISWTSDDDAFDISRTTNINYSFKDVNPLTGDQGYDLLSYESDFARKYVKSKFTEDKVYHLYYKYDAQEVVERDQLINSLSSSIIKIKGSMNFQNVPIGARVLLELDNFYIPFGANLNNQRVGIVTKKTVSGEKVDIEVADLGAIVLRTAKISGDDDASWQDSPEVDHPTRGYIVDDNGIIEEDEYMIGTQLIS